MSSKSSSTSSKNRLKRKTNRTKHSDNDNDTGDSSGEELDLTKECHPISYYINDRTEMINQMFSVIKGSKLRSMLPPVLKNYDIDKLKVQCLDQLFGMSEKRIMSILDGETLTSSSESVHSDSTDSSEAENNGDTVKEKTDGSKTLLEILELEMRARVIRALLASDETNEKEEVIDLTSEIPPVIKTEPVDKIDENTNEQIKKEKLMAEQELRNKLLKRTRKTMENKESKQQKVDGLGTNVQEESNLMVTDKEQLHDEHGDVSWRERWMRKEGVQKIVQSSRIFGKVKKRIASKLNSESDQSPVSQSPIAPLEGSVGEYAKLKLPETEP